MNHGPADQGFFVGYFKKVPPALVRFALVTGVGFVGVMLGVALALALSTADPGSGRYEGLPVPGEVAGVIEELPYPILRRPPDDKGLPRTVLLGGQGKSGVATEAAGLSGKTVLVGGVFVRRGDIDMLLVSGSGLKGAPAALAGFTPSPAQALGRWRLTGEICDGKCYAGAMKPGAGLAHKACANLCIVGGLPPVLVMALPVEGRTVALLADADGGPMPDALFNLTAVPVELEGTLERRDDLLIFRVDRGSARRL